jgi:uncharacterized protein
MDKLKKNELSRLTREYGGDWGINHTQRLLHLIEIIGENLEYDRDIVWAATHLHDWGAYSPWMQKGVDHAQRSGEVAREYLQKQGFSEDWVQKVLLCIETHHQGEPNRAVEALLISDADALDFLGVVGILRDFSKKPKSLREAYETVQKRKAKLPGQLCFERSRQMAVKRISEMESVLQLFEQDSFGCF